VPDKPVRRPVGSKRTYGSFGSKRDREALSWGTADFDVIARAIEAVTAAGDALVFGRTTDGGALSLSVLSGGERYTEYASSVEDAEDALRRATEDAKLG
jgi:hypothetical protein